MENKASLIYPDKDGCAHIIFKDGTQSAPLLTKSGALRLLDVAYVRKMLTLAEVAAMAQHIKTSTMPENHELGDVILNQGDFTTLTSIIAGGNSPSGA